MKKSLKVDGAEGRLGASRRWSFASDVLKLVGGATIAQVLSILVAPVLSRLYAPEAFGTAAVFNSIVTILGVIACLRYELAIMLPESDEDAANLLVASLGITLLIFVLSAIPVLFARYSVASLLKAPDLALYMWGIPLVILARGVFLALNYWNSRMKHFGRLSIAQVSKSVMVNGFQLGVAVIGQAHAGGLIGSTVLGAVTVSAVLARQIWRDDKRIFMQNIRLSHIFQGMRRYRKFPLFNTWSALINTGSRQLPAFFLTFFFSPTVAGYYAVGNRVLHLPISLIGSAIGQVFFQRASATYQGEESLSGLVLSLFRRLVAFGLFPTFLLMIVGEDLFTLVFGSQWSEAGVYAQILSPWMFFVFISSPMSTLFSILERQEAALLRDIGILVSRAATLGIGGVLGDERLTLFLFSGSGVLVYGALSFWILKMSSVSRSSIFYVLLRYLGVSILIISPLVAIKFLTSAGSLVLLAGAVITGGIYGLFLIRQESELIQQLKQLVA